VSICRTPRWPKRIRAAFLEALAETGNVSAAAASVGRSRPHAYRLRATDDGFAAGWAIALDAATDMLEAEARRRALEGVTEPVIRAGRVVMDEAGQPLTVRHYSDRLLELLLRAHRPEKFRDRPQPPSASPSPPLLTLEAVDAEIARLEAALDDGVPAAGRDPGSS
jgi:hypothetical protein